MIDIVKMKIELKKIIQRFSNKHKDKITQSENNNKKLRDILDELYDEYYENEYEKWCETNEDFLIKLKFDLANAASKGLGYYKFVFISHEETNDKYHFKEWLDENDLSYDYELYNHQLEENDVVNQYSFEIKWK